MTSFSVRIATPADTATIMRYVRELAEYEKLLHEVVLTTERSKYASVTLELRFLSVASGVELLCFLQSLCVSSAGRL